MKKYFGYVRISDPKQNKGVSPKVQRSDIAAFAKAHDIEIGEWFVEVQTAAKAGRTVFSKMLARLEKGDADGVVFHKIDRSARNLEDWNNVGRLFDHGIDVQFAHESIDLRTRGGRLSADIIAVVAADYIRNLREESRKGFYGRLSQGVYPLPAPIGYLDMGKGQPKALDPERAAVVQWTFERYATGEIGLKQLRKEIKDKGLRSRSGKPLSLTGLSKMLNNPFYMGLIRIKSTGETFEGKHPPIVQKALFERVQAILQGKTVAKVFKHDYLFRRLVRCTNCSLHLIGERQKGHVYYRCHSENCKGTSLREEAIEHLVQNSLGFLAGDRREIGEIREMVEVERIKDTEAIKALRAALEMRRIKCGERLSRLTDALIDQLIDKPSFEERKQALLKERRGIADEIDALSTRDLPHHRALAILELGNIAYSGYVSAIPDERRRILAQVTSNLYVCGKNPAITLKSPFREIANWRKTQDSAPCSGTPRTRAAELLALILSVDRESQTHSVLAP